MGEGEASLLWGCVCPSLRVCVSCPRAEHLLQLPGGVPKAGSLQTSHSRVALLANPRLLGVCKSTSARDVLEARWQPSSAAWVCGGLCSVWRILGALPEQPCEGSTDRREQEREREKGGEGKGEGAEPGVGAGTGVAVAAAAAADQNLHTYLPTILCTGPLGPCPVLPPPSRPGLAQVGWSCCNSCCWLRKGFISLLRGR